MASWSGNFGAGALGLIFALFPLRPLSATRADVLAVPIFADRAFGLGGVVGLQIAHVDVHGRKTGFRPRVDCDVRFGQQRLARYNPATGMTQLVTSRVSLAAASSPRRKPLRARARSRIAVLPPRMSGAATASTVEVLRN